MHWPPLLQKKSLVLIFRSWVDLRTHSFSAGGTEKNPQWHHRESIRLAAQRLNRYATPGPVCVYIYIYIHTHTHTTIDVCIYTVYTCIYCVYIYTYVSVYIYILYIYVYIYTHTYIYIYVCVCVCVICRSNHIMLCIMLNNHLRIWNVLVTFFTTEYAESSVLQFTELSRKVWEILMYSCFEVGRMRKGHNSRVDLQNRLCPTVLGTPLVLWDLYSVFRRKQCIIPKWKLLGY